MRRLLCALLMLAQSACAPDPGAPAERSVLHRGNGPEPATLDPQQAEGTPEYNILRDLYEGLLSESPQARLVPGAAERWSVSPDGRQYSFTLRAAGRWSNGAPVTADQFVAALRRAVEPATASPNAFLLEPVRGAAEIIAGRAAPETLGVRAADARTLIVELVEPAPYFPGVLAHPVSFPRASEPGLGNGAYRLVEHRTHDYVRLERNPWYWNAESVDIDEVYFHAVADAATEVSLYRAGQLDLTSEIPNSAFEWIRRELADELFVAPYLSSYGYAVNVAQPPFADSMALRQALSLAVDRRALVEHVTGVGEQPAWSWVPPGLGDYVPPAYDWRLWPEAERLAEARRLYGEAAAAGAASTPVELLYDASPNHRRTALAIADMWRDTLGIDVALREQEWRVFLEQRRDPQRGGLTRLGWVGDYNDPQTFLGIFTSGHPQNVTGYADPAYDALIEAAATELDPAARQALLREAEQRLLEAYVVLPLFFYVSKHLVKPHVAGFEPNVMNHHYTRHLRLTAK